MMHTNDGLPFLTNALITEYDIKKGNTSMMRTFQMIPEEDIAILEKLPKKERVVRVGLLQKNNKEFAKALEANFDAVVKRFIEENELDIDVDILAIRRDAVFVVNRPVRVTQIGEFITFIPKKTYHAYLQLGGRLEFYFGKNGLIDTKNFISMDKPGAKQIIEKLKPGVLSFLNEFIEICEATMMNRKKVYAFLATFCTLYKEKTLDVEYYREFTREASFRMHGEEGDIMMDLVPDDMIDDLDISYNYVNIIVPLLQVII